MSPTEVVREGRFQPSEGRSTRPDVPLEDQFQPSHDTKRYLLSTRKTEATFAGVTLPGLFQISHAPRDSALVLAAIALELWGLSCLVSLTSGRLAVVIVFLVFMLDLIFAIVRHLPEGKICEWRNRLVYESDQVQRARFRSRIRMRIVGQRTAALVICLIAVFKIASFYYLAQEGIDALVASILVSYVVVAVIHVNVTGYVLAFLAESYHHWRDKRAFVNSEETSPLQITEHAETMIVTEVALRAHNIGLHELKELPAIAGGEKRYSLRTWGVLEDRELQTLIAFQQSPEAEGVVAREGVRHQVEKILQLNIPRF